MPTIYYDFGTSVSSSSYEDGGGIPSAPAGATVITQAQYDVKRSAIAAATAQTIGVQLAAEETANRLKYNSTVRVVASATAPQRVKDISTYLCDGTDDQVQINQALAAVAAEGGGTVLLSAGTFLLGDSVLMPTGQGTNLTGTGWNTVLKVGPASNRYAIMFDGTEETRALFRDFTIDGNYFEQTSGGGGIFANGAVQCHFLNLHFVACYDYALHLGPSDTVVFGHTNYVTNCLFDNMMGSPGAGCGIRTTSNDENFIIGCDFEFMGGAQGLATSIYDQAGTQLIQGCNFVNGRADKPAVRIQDCAATKVVNCNFDGVSGSGVVAAASRCVISDNTFFGVGLNGTAGANTGVHLEFASRDNTVSDNMLATAPDNGAAHSLIRETGDGGAGGNLIQGNTLVTNGTAVHGVLDLSGAGSMIRGNKGAGALGDESPPVKVVAGPVTDASFPANRPPVDGALAVDSVNSRLYVRAAGVWKSTPLV